MTADKDKEVVAVASRNTHCLICNSRFGVSSRNCCEIFTKNLMSDDRPVAYTISAVLGLDVNEDTAHSNVVCKKCFKLLYEVDEIESRLVEIKTELVGSYKKTVKIQNDEELHQDVVNDDNRKLPLGSDENNIVKYKLTTKTAKKANILKKNAAPLSSTNSDEESEQKAHNTLKDAKLSSLVAGAVAQRTDQVQLNMQASSKKQENTHCEVEMSEHGSDSEYTLELTQEEQELSVEHDGDQIIVQIKMEPDEDMALGLSDKESNVKRTKRKRSIKDEDFELPEKLMEKEGTDFSCCLCSGDEKMIFDMKGIIAHMKAAHSVRIYICDICGQDFRKRNDLSVHLDEHVATEEGDFQCEVCNRIFSNLRLFRVHKRMHYPQNKLWTCETCGKRYSSRNLLDEHINTHTGVRPYMCQTCGKDFASKYTFKAHTKTHEIRPRPYVCGECHKSFLSAQNLQQHERTHNGMRNYVCDQCGKAFGTARNLEVHAVVHTGYKPYVCRVCGKAFARKAEIRDHERTHTGEKPYQCEFCGATFSQRSNLQSHKRATHYQDKRYKCNDCGKGFKRRRLLDYHMKAAHTGERPYKCPTCEATFVYPEHFKKHRRIHTGEKPFHCEVCGKAFNSRDNRNAHRFVHSDKKPYECLVCGMGFMRKPLLYNHMQTQGHLNDTIVVNQPRLTTDDDLILESSVAEVAAEIEEELNRIDDQTESKLYITEMKDVVMEHDGEEEKSADEGGDSEEEDHIIIDGQVHFDDEGELADIREEMESVAEITTAVHSVEGRRSLVVPATPHMLSASRAVQAVRASYEEEVTVDQTASEQLADLVPAQELQTGTGAVHLVQIRIPSADNPTGNHTWFNIVDNQE